ncbi:MAG TPA: PilZ domain-containing protein [Tepidisphaeraceae bacterium]
MVAFSSSHNPFAIENPADRRMFPRKEVHAHVQGKRVDHTVEALREPLMTMALRDVSLGGLSAITDVPLKRGERVLVSFPAQGVSRGWDAQGRVIRCEPSAMGYRLAMEFDQVPLAA